MLKVLGLHNWTKELPPEVQQEVLAATQLRRFSDGEVIYNIADPSEACYQIKTGMVELLNYTYSGKQIVMVEFRSGDCFGEAGIIDDLPRYNNAVSIGDTLLQVLSKKSFNQLYAKHDVIARALNRFFSYRLRNVYSVAEDASLLTLKERLVSLVARLATSRGVNVEGVTVLDGASHERLSHMLGATRQAVSRELKSLEKEGLLQLKYGKMHIPDLEKIVSKYEQMMSGELVVPEYDPIYRQHKPLKSEK